MSTIPFYKDFVINRLWIDKPIGFDFLSIDKLNLSYRWALIMPSPSKYIATRYVVNNFKGISSGFRPSIINYVQSNWIARNFVSFMERLECG